MLELLLRLLGLKKRRRRRVYAQPPLPPGVGQTAASRSARPAAPPPPGSAPSLRREAEVLTDAMAEKVARDRERSRRKGIAAVPVIGWFFRPSRVRTAVSMPAPPGTAQNRAPGEGDRAARRAKRPRKTIGQLLREIVAEIGATWTGPVGRFARRTVWVLLVYVAPAVAVAVPTWFVAQEMRQIGVVVEPLSVPADVAKTGRTPEVLAQLLIDQVDATRHDIQFDRTERRPQDLPLRELPFDLAAPDDTLRSIALWIRGALRKPAPVVTGAVTTLANRRLSLRIYMTGMNRGAPVAALEDFAAEDLNRVVAGAAPLLVRAISPRAYAWYLANHATRFDVLQEGLHSLITDPASGSVDGPTRDTVDFLIGRNYARTGRGDEAMDIADALIKRSPAYPPGQYLRALALLAQNDPDEALAAAQAARKLDGDSPWGFKATARILTAAGKVGDALADIRTARRLDPNDGSAIEQEVEILLTMRRIDEAAATVRIGLERTPGQPGMLEVAAGVMLARGRPDVALGLINNELRQRPERVSALILKARLMSAVGRGQDALEAAEAALRLQPTNGIAQTARGYALIALGRPTEALALLTKLHDSAPENASVLQGQALALETLGRKDEAIATFRKVLDLQPDFGAARKELEKLQGTAAAPVASTAPIVPPSAEFKAAPVDVGPAPAPRAPAAERGQLPSAPGAFSNPAPRPAGIFRRPDSEPSP